MRTLQAVGAITLLGGSALLNLSVLAYFVARGLLALKVQSPARRIFSFHRLAPAQR